RRGTDAYRPGSVRQVHGGLPTDVRRALGRYLRRVADVRHSDPARGLRAQSRARWHRTAVSLRRAVSPARRPAPQALRDLPQGEEWQGQDGGGPGSEDQVADRHPGLDVDQRAAEIRPGTLAEVAWMGEQDD